MPEQRDLCVPPPSDLGSALDAGDRPRVLSSLSQLVTPSNPPLLANATRRQSGQQGGEGPENRPRNGVGGKTPSFWRNRQERLSDVREGRCRTLFSHGSCKVTEEG